MQKSKSKEAKRIATLLRYKKAKLKKLITHRDVVAMQKRKSKEIKRITTLSRCK